MRSKKELEQELEFYQGALIRRERNVAMFKREIPEYKYKIELLRWVLEMEVKHD